MNPDLEVIGEAATAVSAVARMLTTPPDVAVIDVNLPDGDGIEVCREVRAARPEVACLILTSYADDEAVAQAVQAGAAGYVLKQVHGSDLARCIRKAAAGEPLLDPRAAQRIRGGAHHDHGEPSLATLTIQERRILELLATGMTNREIGAELALAEKTVKNYVSNLLGKMGMERRSEAAAFAGRLAERRAHHRHRDDSHLDPIRY